MKTKIISSFLILAISIGNLFASVQVGDLYYDLEASTLTAQVTFKSYKSSTWSYNENWSITSASIPSSITYQGKTYQVTSIGDHAFWDCSGLTSVTIPNSVTCIGNYAFYNCTGLTSVTIGNSVTSIEYKAFYDCSGLTKITIPTSVTSIGEFAFSGCNNITSVIWNAKNCSDFSISEYAPFNYISSQITSLTFGEEVEHIPAHLCSTMSNLTSVTIPNSVTSIGKSAFSGCSGLTSVNITDIAAWCNIAFSIYDNNPLYYAEHLYVNNVEVTNLVIPEGVTSIGNYAFRSCSSLTSVTIPNSVTRIGESAFYYCRGLTSVTIPNSVTRIGESAFYYCRGLTSVTIGNSVTYIGESAFYGCSGLTSVTNFANTPQEITSSVFDKVDKSTCVLYVPAGSISAYKSANQWKDFSNILPIGAQPADVTTTTVTPSATTADIAWPQVTGAATYTIEIKKNGELICTLIFNAQGQLISIAFAAPSRNNAPQQAQAAGFAFTVTSLDSGTTYSYTMTAKGNNGNVLKTESGTFTTSGAQGFDEVQSEQVQGSKILRNGQIFILRGEKEYTLTGQEVK